MCFGVRMVFARCSQTKQQTLKKEKQIYGNEKRKNIHQLQSSRQLLGHSCAWQAHEQGDRRISNVYLLHDREEAVLSQSSRNGLSKREIFQWGVQRDKFP